MNDRAQELIDGLRRRATSCNEVANNYDLRHDSLAAERCRAKARAYEHSAELAQQILGTEREPDLGSGFVAAQGGRMHYPKERA